MLVLFLLMPGSPSPSCRFEGCCSSAVSSPGPQWPLVRLVALQSVVSNEGSGLSGCLIPSRASRFPTARRSSSAAVPRALASSGSSSRELGLLFRVRSCLHPAPRPRLPASSERLLQGLSPLRDISSWSPLTGQLPTLAYVPSAAFRTLSTASSSTILAGLFHPAATSGIRASGVFPAARPPRLIGEPCPPVVRPEFPTNELPRWCQSLSPRLQGFSPGSDPSQPTGG
jgi:hypothetical protein